MKHILLFKLLERRASKGWRGTLESTRRLMGIFSKILLAVFGRLTKGHCLAVYSMSREIIRLYRKSGALFTSQYLKQTSFVLMWYVGGDRSVSPKLKTYVSLTRSGIPRIIPPAYRKEIRRGNPLVVQIVLSICTLSRLMIVIPRGGGRINPSTIHDPSFQLTEPTKKFCAKLVSSAFSVLSAYAPSYREIPLKLGFSFRPMFTSGPNTYKNPAKESTVLGGAYMKKLKLSIYHTLPVDASALLTLFSPEDLSELGSLWMSDRIIYPDSGYDNPIEPVREGATLFGFVINSLILPAQRLWWDSMITRPELGRFGRKYEGAGKVRVFAIANPLLQTLVRPLHDWAMSVLRTIPMDGTFNQLAPLQLLKGKRELFSFDLKSATDLLPVDLSGSLLVSLFGNQFAQSWCFLMTMCGFRSPEKVSGKLKARVYRFTRGQPLGYYSSWPVFTLTHHMIVWMAAYEVHPRKLFKDYAILGDDIVIADREVAKVYARLMEEIQAVISKEKSLVSFKGACEFAKRFIINNHLDTRADISPLSVPLVKLCSGFTSAFVFKKLGCSFRNSFRLRGGGYHVYSKIRESRSKDLFCNLSNRWKRHWLACHAPSGIHPLPLRLWWTYPDRAVLSCYEEGLIREYILRLIQPRDIDGFSLDALRLFWENDDFNMLERFLKSFVEMHLTYLQWYAKCIFDYTLPFEYLLDPPISPRKIKRTSEVSDFAKYGFYFKIWDYLRVCPVPKALGRPFCGRVNRDYLYMVSDGCVETSMKSRLMRRKQLSFGVS